MTLLHNEQKLDSMSYCLQLFWPQEMPNELFINYILFRCFLLKVIIIIKAKAKIYIKYINKLPNEFILIFWCFFILVYILGFFVNKKFLKKIFFKSE